MPGMVLKRSLGPDEDESAWTNPWDARVAAQMERMNAPRAPMYTPEEIGQRRGQNDMEYQLGLLGMLSGHTGLQDAGGAVFKNALSNRQKKVSEHGTADPITGEFTYNPDYLDEREATKLEAMQKLQIAAGLKHSSDVQERNLRRDTVQARNDNAVLIKTLGAGGGGELGAGVAPQIGATPEGTPIFRDKATGKLFTYNPQGQATPYGAAVGPKTVPQPSEDERKAAGWFFQADNAWRNMQKVMTADPKASQVPGVEKGLGIIPVIGEDLANTFRSESRQKFLQAASSLSEALLRAATGAGMNLYEAQQKVAELTPVYGEKPGTTKQKMDAIPIFMSGLRSRAGRALPPAAAPAAPGAGPLAAGGADPADPLGFYGSK